MCAWITVIGIAMANAAVLVHSEGTNPVCVIQAAAFAQDLRKKEAVILKQLRCHSEAAFPEGIGDNSGQQVVETVAPAVGHHDLGSSRTIPVQS